MIAIRFFINYLKKYGFRDIWHLSNLCRNNFIDPACNGSDQ